ncbi:hypothetical protein R84B8_02947 [Treponema sp. R8-4-B8]
MKNNKIVLIVLVLTAFCIMGCGSSADVKKAAPVPIRYSFAETNNSNMGAVIKFVKEQKEGIRFYDCDGVMIPAPAEGTYWLPDILFPAEKPMELRVYIYWNEDQSGERRRGIYKCPPLEAGKEYKLWFKGTLNGGKIYLTYSNVDKIVFSFKGQPQFEILHEQIIPPLPK